MENKTIPKIRVMKTSDSFNKYFKALLFSDTGMGKTTSIKGHGDCKGLDPATTLLIVTERGAKALEDRDFSMIFVRSWEEFEAVKEGIVNKSIEGIDFASLQTIVVDSVTSFADMLRGRILGVDRPQLYLEKTSNKSDRPSGVYEDSMTLQDYGIYKSRLSKVVCELVTMPYNVIVMALAKKRVRHDGTELQVPCVEGSYAFEIGSSFDFVFYMTDHTFLVNKETGETKTGRVWQTSGGGDTICKDTTGKLPRYIKTDWSILTEKQGEKKT